MRAVVAVSGNQENPFEGFSICDHPDPVVPEGWVRVAIKAAAINHHDVWTLRGTRRTRQPRLGRGRADRGRAAASASQSP